MPNSAYEVLPKRSTGQKTFATLHRLPSVSRSGSLRGAITSHTIDDLYSAYEAKAAGSTVEISVKLAQYTRLCREHSRRCESPNFHSQYVDLVDLARSFVLLPEHVGESAAVINSKIAGLTHQLFRRLLVVSTGILRLELDTHVEHVDSDLYFDTLFQVCVQPWNSPEAAKSYVKTLNRVLHTPMCCFHGPLIVVAEVFGRTFTCSTLCPVTATLEDARQDPMVHHCVQYITAFTRAEIPSTKQPNNGKFLMGFGSDSRLYLLDARSLVMEGVTDGTLQQYFGPTKLTEIDKFLRTTLVERAAHDMLSLATCHEKSVSSILHDNGLRIGHTHHVQLYLNHRMMMRLQNESQASESAEDPNSEAATTALMLECFARVMKIVLREYWLSLPPGPDSAMQEDMAQAANRFLQALVKEYEVRTEEAESGGVARTATLYAMNSFAARRVQSTVEAQNCSLGSFAAPPVVTQKVNQTMFDTIVRLSFKKMEHTTADSAIEWASESLSPAHLAERLCHLLGLSVDTDGGSFIAPLPGRYVRCTGVRVHPAIVHVARGKHVAVFQQVVKAIKHARKCAHAAVPILTLHLSDLFHVAGKKKALHAPSELHAQIRSEHETSVELDADIARRQAYQIRSKDAQAVSQQKIQQFLEESYNLTKLSGSDAPCAAFIVQHRISLITCVSKKLPDAKVAAFIEQGYSVLEALARSNAIDIKNASWLWNLLFDAHTFVKVAVGDSTGAMNVQKQRLEHESNVFGRQSIQVAAALNDWASLCVRAGDLLAAKEKFESARALMQTVNAQHPTNYMICNNLAFVYYHMSNAAKSARASGGRNPDEARRLLLDAASLLEDLMSKKGQVNDPILFADMCNNYGSILLSKGDFGTASTMFNEAVQQTKGILPNSHPDRANAIANAKICERKRRARAALWIACWFRRYQARKELRRRKTVAILAWAMQAIGRGYAKRRLAFQALSDANWRFMLRQPYVPLPHSQSSSPRPRREMKGLPPGMNVDVSSQCLERDASGSDPIASLTIAVSAATPSPSTTTHDESSGTFHDASPNPKRQPAREQPTAAKTTKDPAAVSSSEGGPRHGEHAQGYELAKKKFAAAQLLVAAVLGFIERAHVGNVRCSRMGCNVPARGIRLPHSAASGAHTPSGRRPTPRCFLDPQTDEDMAFVTRSGSFEASDVDHRSVSSRSGGLRATPARRSLSPGQDSLPASQAGSGVSGESLHNALDHNQKGHIEALPSNDIAMHRLQRLCRGLLARRSLAKLKKLREKPKPKAIARTGQKIAMGGKR